MMLTSALNPDQLLEQCQAADWPNPQLVKEIGQFLRTNFDPTWRGRMEYQAIRLCLHQMEMDYSVMDIHGRSKRCRYCPWTSC